MKKKRRTESTSAGAQKPSTKARFKIAARLEAQLDHLSTRDPVLRKRCRKAIERLLEAPERLGSHLEPITGTAATYTARVDRNYRLLLQKHDDEEGSFYLIVAVARHDDAY